MRGCLVDVPKALQESHDVRKLFSTAGMNGIYSQEAIITAYFNAQIDFKHFQLQLLDIGRDIIPYLRISKGFIVR